MTKTTINKQALKKAIENYILMYVAFETKIDGGGLLRDIGTIIDLFEDVQIPTKDEIKTAAQDMYMTEMECKIFATGANFVISKLKENG